MAELPPPIPVQAAVSQVKALPMPRWKLYMRLAVLLLGIGGVWVVYRLMVMIPAPHPSPSGVSDVGGAGIPLQQVVARAELPPPRATPIQASGPLPAFSGNSAAAPRVARMDGFVGTVVSSGRSGGSPAAPSSGGSVSRETPAAASTGEISAPETASAHRVNEDLTLGMGGPISCITESPIDTQVPGGLRCQIDRPVRSMSGRVDLLDAGSWAIMETLNAPAKGNDRAFAKVIRLQGRGGCIVNVSAPVSDQLGTPGIDGVVNTHFWERFQGLVMVAALDLVSQTLATAAANALSQSNNGGTSVNLNQFGAIGGQAGQGMAQEANIPNSLSTHQGRRVLLFVRHDIDFSGCYRLSTRQEIPHGR